MATVIIFQVVIIVIMIMATIKIIKEKDKQNKKWMLISLIMAIVTYAIALILFEGVI